MKTSDQNTLLIPSQKHLFDLTDDVSYFNCAYTSPLLSTARNAGEQALANKSTPWLVTPAHFLSGPAHLKSLLAQLLNCAPSDMALVPSVSYGIAIAARNIPMQPSQTIVVVEEQFPSNVYTWQTKARECGGSICTVERPADGNWTPHILDSITSQTRIVALPAAHWTDGTRIDLAAVGARCREVDAALVLDLTQSLGAVPFDVQEVQPDFMVSAGHKWMMGAYALSYLYAAPKYHAAGIPLEENWLNREGSEDFSRLVDYRDGYQDGATRFDMGEVSNFGLIPVAISAVEQILAWDPVRISATLQVITAQIADRAQELGMSVYKEAVRSPHMLGASFADGIPANALDVLSSHGIYASIRGNSIRIAPHLYTEQRDVEILMTGLARLCACN